MGGLGWTDIIIYVLVGALVSCQVQRQYDAVWLHFGLYRGFELPRKTWQKGYRKLWGKVKALEALQPHANPRSMPYPVPHEQNNGFIYAKVHGDFEKIKASICDLVAVSMLLNATLVIPEIQESTQSKGISSKFKSFSYLYNEEQFISVLANDVVVAKNLPHDLMEGSKHKQYPIFKPKRLSSPNYYLQDVLPKLKSAKVIGLILTDGGCLQEFFSLLLPSRFFPQAWLSTKGSDVESHIMLFIFVQILLKLGTRLCRGYEGHDRIDDRGRNYELQ